MSGRLPLVPEIVIACVGVGAFYVFPDDLAFLTQIVITAILVLSLSLVLGQAGIATLGQAAYYGAGGYAAGLFAIHVWPDPLAGLVVGALFGAALAAVTGLLLLRTHGLSFLMLTIALLQILYEVANRARAVTGGDDGLPGIAPNPVLGFEFDLFSQTAYLYALAVLVAAYLLLRKIFESPFGLTCRGIRSDRGRVTALGGNVYLHLLAVFTMGGGFAGLAGALSAQTAGVVGLNSLTFGFSGNVLVMLILGGARRLPGALIGTVIFMVIQHVASTINPYHWLFVIGGLLIAGVLVLPNGIVSLFDAPLAWARRRGRSLG